MIKGIYFVTSEKGTVGLVLPLEIVRDIQKKERLIEADKCLKIDIGGKGHERS